MSNFNLLFIVLLGIVIAFGIHGRSTLYLAKSTAVITVLLMVMVAVDAGIGNPPSILLALDLHSKSSVAVFLCYSFYVGVAVALINKLIRYTKGE